MYRILVVDDEDAVRTAVRRRIEREGFEADEAEMSLRQREDQRSGPPYDVVVTDMVMDGEGRARNAKAAVSRDIFTEVIVLTACRKRGERRRLHETGAFDYVEEEHRRGRDDLLVLKIEQSRAAAALVHR